MPRSTTVWAAALLLASLSGSGPMLTTAEAMPAPGPQQTAGRPRYYFPRHVKRQIVTNSSAPAAPTSSTSSSSSTSDLESRQTSDFSNFINSFSHLFSSQSLHDSSSSSSSSSSPVLLPSSSTTIIASSSAQDVGTIGVTPVPVPPPVSNIGPPVVSKGKESSTTAYTPQPPIPLSTYTPPSPGIGSTGGVPNNVVPPSSTSNLGDTFASPPGVPSSAASTNGLPSTTVQPTSPALFGTTGGVPAPVISPTSPAVESSIPLPSAPKPSDKPLVGSTGVLPSSNVLPSVPLAASSTGLLPSIFPTPTLSSASKPSDEPLVESTGVLPSNVLPSVPLAASSTGLLPSIFPTPTLSSAPKPSDKPLVGSTGVLPSSNVLPSVPLAASSTGLLPSTFPTPALPSLGSTGGVPETILAPTPPAPASEKPASTGGALTTGPFIVNPIPQPSSSLNQPLGSSGGVPNPSGSSGGLPGSVVLPTTDVVPTSAGALPSLPSSGIVVGITTAFGTDKPTPTQSLAIPTSESKPLFSSLVSQLSSLLQPSETPGVIPSTGAPGPTAPSPNPSGITPLPVLPSLVSHVSSALSSALGDRPSLSIPYLPSVVSSIASSIAQTTGTAPVPGPIESIISSIGASLSSAIPTLLPPVIPGTSSSLLPSEYPPSSILPTPTPTPLPGTSSGILPPPVSSGISSGTSIRPGPTGSTGISTPIPSPTSTGIPVSEVPPSSAPTIPSSLPPSSTKATNDVPSVPASTPKFTPTPVPSSSDIEIPFLPTTKPKSPIATIGATATDSETMHYVGSSINQEPSTVPSPTATSIGIPSELPKMISPPTGIPPAPANAFFGQIGFNWKLNYPFVCKNDSGNQIFTYLPMAITHALNITEEQVTMKGLKPFDTTQYQGFITTLALFYIPADLADNLKLQLQNPADRFWHHENQTVNDLTKLINTAIPLPAGTLPEEGSSTLPGKPGATGGGGVQGGGVLGGDMSASRKVNPTSAGIATGAVMGAIAYGAAMFYVARRYRNKKMSHQRSSSVPSSRRFTYGSSQGAGGAFMSGGRGPGRFTPSSQNSRGSRGSGSSQGRSIRTQQISAPVMAENSLGWN